MTLAHPRPRSNFGSTTEAGGGHATPHHPGATPGRRCDDGDCERAGRRRRESGRGRQRLWRIFRPSGLAEAFALTVTTPGAVGIAAPGLFPRWLSPIAESRPNLSMSSIGIVFVSRN